MITMHFPPGARGDFLGGFLLGSISERNNFAAVQAPWSRGYKKIHHTDNFDFLKDPNTIKIRIDANFNAANYLNIAHNHINKNGPEILLDDPIDQHYTFIKDIVNRDKDVYNHKQYYDYWIDFSILNNFDFLCDLYVLVNKTAPDEFLLESALSNINQQSVISNDCEKLIDLLDFELQFNLLNYYRSFDHNKFIGATDPKSLLKLSNYSKSKFV
jgi:hypothetical protein